MPEYDIVNYPKEMTPNLTDSKPGGTSDSITKAWPAAPVLPEQYTGAVPSREFETNQAHVLVAKPVPDQPQPSEVADPGSDLLPGMNR